jgi:hypothetical protein
LTQLTNAIDQACDREGGAKGFGGKGTGKPSGGLGAPGTPENSSAAPKPVTPPKSVTPPLVREVSDDVDVCSDSVPEKGRQAVVPNEPNPKETPHLLYNKDGFYIKVAACYIQRLLKKSGST